MAREIPVLPYTLVAAVDLSANQYGGVDCGTSGTAVLPSAGGRIIGIQQNAPTAGRAATIEHGGISKFRCGAGGVTAGDDLMAAADGTLITATATNKAVGVALDTVAAAEIGTCLLLSGQNTNP